MRRPIIIGLLIFSLIAIQVAAEDSKDQTDILKSENTQLRKEIKTMKEETKKFKTQVDMETAELQLRIFSDINDGEFKCYENYRTITDTTSDQWALQQKAYTGQYGLRMVDGYFCVAMGSKFGTKIGQKYIIEMANGNNLKVILADQKANCDTDAENMKDPNGCIIEFLVEEERMPKLVRQMGDISFAHYEFYGPIKNIVEDLS